MRFVIFCGSSPIVSYERMDQHIVFQCIFFNALLTIGFTTPYGGRKKRGNRPVIFAISRSVARNSALILRDEKRSNQLAWLKEWLPIRWPC